MSREELKNFVRAVERNYSLRKEIHRCNSYNDLFHIAQQFGFNISLKDFEEDKNFSDTREWFEKSNLTKIKYNF